MKKSMIVVIVAVAIAVVMFAKCNHAENMGEQSRLQKMIAIQKMLDKPITYFGKVVDLHNAPVPNASVNIQIGQASGVNTKIYLTDSNGVFEVSGISGSDFLITDIIAAGYEFLASNRENDHTGYENDGSRVIERNNPVVFIMRKKEPPTVVIPGDVSVVFVKDVKYYEVDLLKMVDEKPYGLNRYHGANAHIDIKTTVEYSSANDSYTFILEMPDADSGVIALDQMLYVSPETGYKPSYSITVPKGQKTTTYLYVKGRGGRIYTRLDTKFSAETEKIYWAASVATNPLGERNLDRDSEKYREYLRKIDAEAKRMGPKPQ